MSLYKSEHKGVQAVMTINHMHIHMGEHFSVSSTRDTVATSTGYSVVHIDPAEDIHMLGTVTISGGGIAALYENPTLSSTAGASTGTKLTPHNNNRLSTIGSSSKFTINPKVSTKPSGLAWGTTLQKRFIPGAGSKKVSVGIVSGQRQEWILDKTKTYAVAFHTASSANTKVHWEMEYYK